MPKPNPIALPEPADPEVARAPWSAGADGGAVGSRPEDGGCARRPGGTRRWLMFLIALPLSWTVAFALAAASPPDSPASSSALDVHAPPEPTGLWWAEGGFAQVEIHACGEALCGRVAWLRHPLDGEGCELLDVENPDAALRARPVEGLPILHGLRASAHDADEWTGGTIYDPSSGRTYSAAAELDGRDRLRLRGYLGIRLLGRTTTWIRVGSEDQCSARG